jgi:hypothetical protein
MPHQRAIIEQVLSCAAAASPKSRSEFGSRLVRQRSRTDSGIQTQRSAASRGEML